MRLRLALLTAFTAGLIWGQQAVSKIPPVKIFETDLDNGLRVLVVEDHFAPVYALAVSYKVGSRNERKGRTGFAHLFEHMMFKGSENVGAGEHFYTIFANGGTMNGTTNTDRTFYYEVLPKNQLDMGLFLEADRMRSLNITKENLENQRQAVKEERRLGVDNQPYGHTQEKIDELVYDNFTNQHSVIGSMADLDAASVDDVAQFFKTYYAPNNAVLAIVGDVDTKDVLVRVKKYFGAIPKQTAPPAIDLTEPEKTAERRATLKDPLARLTELDIAYRIPEVGNDDARALSIAASILGGGNSSRLYQKIVKEKELATSIFAGVDSRNGPSKLMIEATVRPGKSAAEVESLINEEIARLVSAPVTDKELEKIRLPTRPSAIQSRESVMSIASGIADGAALYNDPNRINTEPDKRMAVTADQILKASQKYLRTANRVVVITEPAPAAPPAAAPKN